MAQINHSAGVIILAEKQDVWMTLLVEHLDRGTYGFIKGHMEIGESIEQTAIREVFEEVGVLLSPPLTPLGEFTRDKSKKRISMFAVVVPYFTPNTATEEVSKWFLLKDVPPAFRHYEDADFWKQHEADLYLLIGANEKKNPHFDAKK